VNRRQPQWFLGAYAGTASLASFSIQDAETFYAEVVGLPSLAGLELPIHADAKADDPWQHIHLLPRDLDYILTPLPAVMQSLAKNPQFGLASTDAAGRRAALQLMDRVRICVQQLEDHCGRKAVRAVQLHSAPTLQKPADDAGAKALTESLEVLCEKDWSAAELWLEHCDTFLPNQPSAKGFLDLQQEIDVLQKFPIGLNINWGRSVLEGRSVATALLHIQQAQQAGVLRALFFSGVALDDPVFGSWLDNHSPMFSLQDVPWQARGSLLTEQAVEQTLQCIHTEHVQLGLKIQPGPATLELSQRVDCLRQHLLELSRVARKVSSFLPDQ